MISLKTSSYLILVIFFSEKRTFGKARRQQKEIQTSETKTLENEEKGDVFIQVENKKYNAWY